MEDPIMSTLRYARGDGESLVREKAYILNYAAPPGVPKSNFPIDFHPDIPIHNLRTAVASGGGHGGPGEDGGEGADGPGLSFAESGLAIATLPKVDMSKADFDDEAKVERVYLPAVHRCLRETLGADEIYIFDYMIRKREPAFPFQPANQDTAPQPALSAHIDYTTDELKFRLEKYFKDRAGEFGKRWYRIVNVWKPLEGPLRDYPMAYCDARTLDPATDLLVTDEVFPTVANEVYQVLHSPRHRWYYIPDQLDTEVAIFTGYDSRRGQAVAVPHCSFDLGKSASGGPRQSIEVRAFVFYGDK